MKRNNKSIKNIAIAGTSDRIGTTTQAMQLLSYFNKNMMRACYIEANSNNYLSNLLYLYEDASYDNNLRSISYQNFKFYKKEDIRFAYESNFDIYIKDYGNVFDDKFELMSFIEQEKKIIVTGVKPNEIFNLQKFIKTYHENNISYIFSFVPKNDIEEILYMTKLNKSYCFFAGICIDMFKYNFTDEIIYKSILGVN